jgi:crossover junction endonuclease MUS81
MADSAKPAKRRKVTHKKPNSLFEEWLKEWRDEAKEKGWQIHFTYHKVLLQ